jgi:hypothetical protein
MRLGVVDGVFDRMVSKCVDLALFCRGRQRSAAAGSTTIPRAGKRSIDELSFKCEKILGAVYTVQGMPPRSVCRYIVTRSVPCAMKEVV